LETLSQLRGVHLYGNPIPNQICPLLNSICHWEKSYTPFSFFNF
jgi:hypothetical protein